MHWHIGEVLVAHEVVDSLPADVSWTHLEVAVSENPPGKLSPPDEKGRSVAPL